MAGAGECGYDKGNSTRMATTGQALRDSCTIEFVAPPAVFLLCTYVVLPDIPSGDSIRRFSSRDRPSFPVMPARIGHGPFGWWGWWPLAPWKVLFYDTRPDLAKSKTRPAEWRKLRSQWRFFQALFCYCKILPCDVRTSRMNNTCDTEVKVPQK